MNNISVPKGVVQRLTRKGVPGSIREGVWFLLSGASSIALDRNPGYVNLVEVEGEFGELIDLDVSRTFCGEKEWQEKGGAKILKRILRVYSVRNPMVGYCQGLSYVGALLLEVCSEEIAFCCLCAIIEDGEMAPDYYTSLRGAVIDRLVLEELAERYVGELCNSLKEEKRSFNEFSFLTVSWFLCLFTATLPVEVSKRIWDFYWAFGICVIFRVSLGVLTVAQGPIVEGEKDVNELRNLIEKSLNGINVCDVPDFCTAFNKVTNTVVETLRESKRKRMSLEEESDRKMGKRADSLDRCFLAIVDPPGERPEEEVREDYFRIARKERGSTSSVSNEGRERRLMNELEKFMMPKVHRGRSRKEENL